MHELDANPTVINVIQELCSKRHLSPALLDTCATDPELKQLILNLAMTNVILPEEE
jgi:hypothetical protein